MQRFGIYAKTGRGGTLALFTWRGSAQMGIDRAKREAVEFGMTDLHDFWAEELPPVDISDGGIHRIV